MTAGVLGVVAVGDAWTPGGAAVGDGRLEATGVFAGEGVLPESGMPDEDAARHPPTRNISMHIGIHRT